MPIFNFLANRNKDIYDEDKSWFRKTIPYIVLLNFLSTIALLMTRLLYYPWDVEAQPSLSSINREMLHTSVGACLFGWANDYQTPLLSSFSDTILWFCWTIYAFQFKPSPTSWKKKMCKVFAYVILSMLIIGFEMHYVNDLSFYAVLLLIAVVLLCIARVKPAKQDISSDDDISLETIETTESNLESDNEPIDKEDYSRFMPTVAEMTESDVLYNEENILQEATDQKKIAEQKLSEFTSNDDSVINDSKYKENSSILDKSQTVSFDMMYCKHCGKIIEADSKFCKYCGKKL